MSKVARKWQKRYKLDDALYMQLYKTCLAWALTDEAESELELTEIECSADIRFESEEIVVEFTELLPVEVQP